VKGSNRDFLHREPATAVDEMEWSRRWAESQNIEAPTLLDRALDNRFKAVRALTVLSVVAYAHVATAIETIREDKLNQRN